MDAWSSADNEKESKNKYHVINGIFSEANRKKEIQRAWERTVEELRETCRALPRSSSLWTWW